MILLAVHMFYRKGKFTNFTKGSVVSTTELLHPTDKMLKKGLWQNYNYTSNLFSAAVVKTTTKSAGNILLQCREISTVIL